MPKTTTGKKNFLHLGRVGPPSELALNPPPEQPYETPDLHEILQRGRTNAKPCEQAPDNPTADK